MAHQAYIGGVAQLGERLPCTQEVIGSNPFTSTKIQVNRLKLRAEVKTFTQPSLQPKYVSFFDNCIVVDL